MTPPPQTTTPHPDLLTICAINDTGECGGDGHSAGQFVVQANDGHLVLKQNRTLKKYFRRRSLVRVYLFSNKKSSLAGDHPKKLSSLGLFFSELSSFGSGGCSWGELKVFFFYRVLETGGICLKEIKSPHPPFHAAACPIQHQ